MQPVFPTYIDKKQKKIHVFDWETGGLMIDASDKGKD